MRCKNCGTNYDGGICPKCGTYNDPLGLKTRDTKKKKTVIIVICVVCVIIACISLVDAGLTLFGTSIKDIIYPDTSPMTESEIASLYSSPGEYKNREISIGGIVLAGTQYDGDTPYIQVGTDLENSEKILLVTCKDISCDFSAGEYVQISGRVSNVVEGENAFGAMVTMPSVIADSVVQSTYIDVFSPTLLGLGGYSQTPAVQNGYYVAIDRVEFAANETRIYMIVQNQGTNNFTLDIYTARIVQNGKQYEPTTNLLADYPQIQGNIAVGVTTDGVITFPAIEHEDFRLEVSGYSDNWIETLQPFGFNVGVEVQ